MLRVRDWGITMKRQDNDLLREAERMQEEDKMRELMFWGGLVALGVVLGAMFYLGV